jgi:PIN domain nuclease of toxin-antitoxin system
MRYLIDTHILLWILDDNEKLTNNMRYLLVSEHSKIYISIASVWEIGIKISLGKLGLKGGIPNLMKNIESNGIEVLNIEPSYVEIIESLKFHHKDPFDRLIIATAMQEKMVVISTDQYFDLYDIQLER